MIAFATMPGIWEQQKGCLALQIPPVLALNSAPFRQNSKSPWIPLTQEIPGLITFWRNGAGPRDRTGGIWNARHPFSCYQMPNIVANAIIEKLMYL